MSLLVLLLLVGAFVCFLLAAFNVVTGRVNLVALGLALVTLAQIIGTGAFRTLLVVVAVVALSGCAIGYETKGGSKFTVGADPDAKQIRATQRLFF